MPNSVADKMRENKILFGESHRALKQQSPKAAEELTEQQRQTLEATKAEHPDQPWKQVTEQSSAINEKAISENLQAYIQTQEITDELAIGEKKEPLTLAKLEELLQRLNITVRNNELTHKTEVRGLPAEYSIENAANTVAPFLKDKLRRLNVTCTWQDIDKFLSLVADKGRYNPFIEALEAKSWTGFDRLGEVFDILGIENDELSKIFVQKWLHQTIALAYNNGSYGADGVLVLQGAQGVGKTRFFAKIAGRPEWFREGASIDLNVKDSIISAISTPITELGELDATLKREQASLKAFITQSFDPVRYPYTKAAINEPRRTSFCATVNPEQFLRDETGSRRFWTIHIDTIDIKRLLAVTPEWALDLFRQVKENYYDENAQGFRLTAGEREALEKRNGKHQKQLDGESQLLQTLDFDMPEKSWKFFKPKEIQSLAGLDKKISDSQMGKILKKIAASDDRIQTKLLHGYNVYRLPLHGETH